jgi:hypothetical protein
VDDKHTALTRPRQVRTEEDVAGVLAAPLTRPAPGPWRAVQLPAQA